MNTKRKTLKMPVRYLMNAVLVALLFVGLSFLTQNVLSTYQNKVLLTGEQFVLKYCLFVAAIVDQSILLRCLDGHAAAVNVGTVRCINAGGGNRLAVCAQREIGRAHV